MSARLTIPNGFPDLLSNSIVLTVPVPAVATVTHLVMFVCAGVIPAVLFVSRVARNIRDTGDRFDFTSNW